MAPLRVGSTTIPNGATIRVGSTTLDRIVCGGQTVWQRVVTKTLDAYAAAYRTGSSGSATIRATQLKNPGAIYMGRETEAGAQCIFFFEGSAPSVACTLTFYKTGSGACDADHCKLRGGVDMTSSGCNTLVNSASSNLYGVAVPSGTGRTSITVPAGVMSQAQSAVTYNGIRGFTIGLVCKWQLLNGEIAFDGGEKRATLTWNE